jgi:peptide/nickel transport system permease protein
MKNLLRILFKSPKFVIGFTMLCLIGAFIVTYPSVNKNDPFEMMGMSYDKPSKEYPLGTDNFGRDVLLELSYGARSSLYVGLIAEASPSPSGSPSACSPATWAAPWTTS